ncbi:MAG: hypothetical protein PG980_000115 [Wolbachia endosymbiont of Ctenocephalides felis wCfeJ]|nr:MAG: hypothetical protein PG980_000115 [Wolbachia endosymbiont of Ctenocephalides felis wCfeJ]
MGTSEQQRGAIQNRKSNIAKLLKYYDPNPKTIRHTVIAIE